MLGQKRAVIVGTVVAAVGTTAAAMVAASATTAVGKNGDGSYDDAARSNRFSGEVMPCPPATVAQSTRSFSCEQAFQRGIAATLLLVLCLNAIVHFHYIFKSQNLRLCYLEVNLDVEGTSAVQ